MAKQTINIGVAANDNTGDPLRTAFTKINDNFDEIYTVGPVSTNIEINDNTISSTNSNGNIIFDPAGTGTVKIEGPTTANGIITVNSTFSGNVIPTANGTQTLGNLSNRWGNVFISGNGIRLGNLLLKETDSKLEIYATDGITNAILSANSTTSGAVLENGNAVVSLAASGNITLFASGSATPVVVSPALLSVPALTATGNVSSGNVSGTTGTFTTVAGTLSTASQTAITSVGTLTALTVTGNVSTGNVSATGIAGTLSTAAQTAITSVGTLTSLAVTGNVSTGNVSGTAGTFSDITSGSGTLTFNSAGADKDIKFSGDTQTNLLVLDAGTDTVNIGTATPVTGAIVNIASTNSIVMPKGTTGERPGTGTVGMVRFNTTSDSLEQYSSTGWTPMGSVFTVIASDSFAGDGSTTAFTLTDSQTTASCIVTINGIVQTPTTAYSVSTTTLTFTEAPVSGDAIEVRKLTTTSTATSLSNAAQSAKIEVVEAQGYINVTGNIVPISNNVGSLGNVSRYWHDVWVGPGSLYVNGQKVVEDISGTITVSADVNENLQLKVTGTGDLELAPGAAGLIQLKGNVEISNGVSIAQAGGGNVTFSNGLATDSITAKTTNTNLGLSGNGTGYVNIADDCTITGNLTVSGTTTTVSSATLNVTDKNITVANGAVDSAAADGAGLTVAGASATLLYTHSGTKWEMNKPLEVTGNVSTGNVSGTAGTFTDVYGTIGTAAQASITSVGTLTALTVTGNVSAGNVSATGIAGTLSTASQTAITSVGTLTSLAVTGNVSGGNLSVSTGQVTATTYTSVGAQTHTTAANGNITLNPHGTGIITLSAPQVFFEDGSFQTSAYNEMYNIRTSDSSTISSTNTDAFGVGPSLTADHTYEFTAFLTLTNSSTGNITINTSTVGTVEYLRAQFTGSAPSTAMIAFPIIATGNVDTGLNTAATYHIMLVGYCKATTTGRLNFKVSTSSGTVTVLTGSNFRFIDKLSTTVGNVA